MNSRERFARTFEFAETDRALLLEDSFSEGFQETVRKSGASFVCDRIEQVPVNMEPLPALKDWRLDRAGADRLARSLDPDDPARLPEDWAARVKAWRGRDHVLQLTAHRGLFLSLGINDWASFESVVETLVHDPGLVRETMGLLGRFHAKLAARILKDVEVDLASFSEPIAGAGGPLVSPRMYEEFALRNYVPIVDALKAGGVRTIAFVSWADADSLIPRVVGAGFNCVWGFEAIHGAFDCLALRRKFGKGLGLIGGIDVDAVLAGGDPLRREFSQKVAPMLEQGGYAPLADGRMRDTMPLANYLEYRRLLEEFAARRKG